MSRNRNDRWRSEYLQQVALSLVDKHLYATLPAQAQQNQRVVWQKQLSERTQCTAYTARVHIRKALEDGISNHKV